MSGTLGLAGRPQGKEMVRVASQLAQIPASGLRIGGGRHIPHCPKSTYLAPLLCAYYRLSLLSSQIHYVPFSWAYSTSVALPPGEFALNSYLTFHFSVSVLSHLHLRHSLCSATP